MERKTKVTAPEGKQELTITREFDLPVELLFRAYTDPDIIEQWMGTKVLKLENRNHGAWRFQTTDDKGTVVFGANGVIHEFIQDKKITRTFKMENTPFDVQLEFLEFDGITDETSTLNIHMIFRSMSLRDELLRLPFAQGINMAHNQLQKIVSKLINPS